MVDFLNHKGEFFPTKTQSPKRKSDWFFEEKFCVLIPWWYILFLLKNIITQSDTELGAELHQLEKLCGTCENISQYEGK